MSYLSIFCRLLIGGLFLVSAFAKLRSLSSFWNDLRGYRLLPRRAEVPVSVALIAAECLVPILLLFDFTTGFGLMLAAGLLTGFAVAMGLVLRRGLITGCGCFGRPSATVRPAHIWRNALLIVVCGVGAVALFGAASPIDPAAVLMLSVAAACVVATFVFFDDLLTLFSGFPERNRT